MASRFHPALNPGFTLIELSVVLAITAIVAMFAAPSFSAWHTRDLVDTRARTLMSTFALARSESVKRGLRVTVCRIDAARHCLAAGKTCGDGLVDWSCGWGVFVEREGQPVLLRVQGALAAVSIAGATTDLSFTPPSGQVIGGFRSFDFASRNGKATARRCVRIAAGGRPRITQGACGASA